MSLFKHVVNYNDIDKHTETLLSTVEYLNWGFLNIGAFTNVNIDDSNIFSFDKSRLRPAKVEGYTNGQVWEAQRNNFVYESGINYNSISPIQISGVYVGGSFYTPDDNVYGHTVDYRNGRVIFSGNISTSSEVQMEYSYKNVCIETTDTIPIRKILQYDVEKGENFFTFSSGDWSINSEKRIQPPLVLIEKIDNVKLQGYELGGRTHWMYFDILLHVFSDNKNECQKVASILSVQKDKTYYQLNFTEIVNSGVYMLDFDGDINENGLQYNDLIKINEDGGYRSSKIYIKDTLQQGPSELNRVYHSPVRFKLQTNTTV